MDTTIADELRAEGRAVGLSEGRAVGLSEGRAVGLSEGRVLGRAEALLEVLEHRGLDVPDTVRDRVLATRDQWCLGRWFERAFVVDSAEALFE